MNKIALVCETPYNLLNTINIVLNQDGLKKSKKDLFIRTKIVLVDDDIVKLEKYGLFDNIFLFTYDRDNSEDEQDNFFSRMRLRVDNFINPVNAINKLLIDRELTCVYDCVYMAYPNPMQMLLVRLKRNCKVMFYEDGCGSYIDGAITDTLKYLKKKERCRFWLKLTRCPWNRIGGLYVYNPKLCLSTFSRNIYMIPKLDENNMAVPVLKDIFNYVDTNTYNKKRIIFLSQPADNVWEKEGFKEITLQVIKGLSEICEEIIIRYHPRDNVRYDTDISVDTDNNMWELFCMDDLDDNIILVSLVSSALMTPKLLYDKEPYIFFIYPLYEKIQKTELNITQLMDAFSKMYSDQKMTVTHSHEELLNKVNEIIKMS